MSARAWLGIGFLVATVATLFVLLSRVEGAPTLIARLKNHATGTMTRLEVEFDTTPELRVGDPVYTVENQAFALQGRIAQMPSEPGGRVRFDLDPEVAARLGQDCEVLAMTPKNDLGWVLRTLAPPEFRAEFLQKLSGVWRKERAQTFAQLKPPLLAVLGDVVNELADSLPLVLATHRKARDVFFRAFETQIYVPELQPVLQSEVLRRIQQRLGPIGAELGAAAWAEISVGDLLSVLWTASKESVGLENSKEMQSRLGKLLETKVLPVLNARVPALLDSVLAALRDAAQEPKVTAAIDSATWKTLQLPEFQAFIEAVLQDWLVANSDLHDRLEAAISNRSLRDPIAALYKAAEPLLEKALEEVLTRPDRKGMDHQLVRVLRRVVLKKEDRYLLLNPKGPLVAPSTFRLRGALGEDL